MFSYRRKEGIFYVKFEVIQEIKANDEILEIIKNYDYTVRNGKIKHLKDTNLQFIEPIKRN